MKLLSVATIALTASQATALSSKDVVDAINDITDLSAKTNDIAKDLKPANLIQNLPKLTDNFKEIVEMVLKDITTLASGAAKSNFAESDQKDVCKSFHGFVKVHQNLLMTIIGQNGILAQNPLTVPLAAVLRVLEGGVDKLAEAIIGTVPTCKDMAMKDLKALDGTLDDTVTKLTSIIPGGSAALAAASGVVGGLTGGLGNVVGGLTGGAKGSMQGSNGNLLGGLLGGNQQGGDGQRGGLLGGLVVRGGVPTSLVTSVTGKASDILASATDGLGGLSGSLPTEMPKVPKGGLDGHVNHGLEDPRGPHGGVGPGQHMGNTLMGSPTALPTDLAGEDAKGSLSDLAARQAGSLSDAKGDAKGAASHASDVLDDVLSHATGILSATGALPAASNALGNAEGGSDGSTGGLLGGLLGHKGGKGNKPAM